MTATGNVPRPKGVTLAAVMWTVLAVLFAGLTLRVLLQDGQVLPVPAGLALLSAILATLLGRGSPWGLPLQVLVLIPGLLLFPFTFVAIILLGYMTRAETVSYFKRRRQGPRWDTAAGWSQGEGPWLIAFGIAGILCLIFSAALVSMLLRHPNL